MQFVSEWATADRRRLVVLNEAVTQVSVRHRQRFPWQTEAGGILLGRRRGNHFEVVEATEPTHPLHFDFPGTSTGVHRTS